jgi:Holliday junction DNA helicase RuvA
MISRISGKLISVTDESAEVMSNGVAYRLLIPSNINKQLLALRDKEVSLFTWHYLEGGAAGGNLIPRLVGFVDEVDREFFLVFTSVQGIGTRKSLKAFVMPIEKIAAAIETGDSITLKSLPGIGERAAQKIIAELKGKCTKFALKRHFEGEEEEPAKETSFKDEAMDVLTQLQYRPLEAGHMIERALAADPSIDDVEKLLSAIFGQMKSTAGKKQ